MKFVPCVAKWLFLHISLLLALDNKDLVDMGDDTFACHIHKAVAFAAAAFVAVAFVVASFVAAVVQLAAHTYFDKALELDMVVAYHIEEHIVLLHPDYQQSLVGVG